MSEIESADGKVLNVLQYLQYIPWYEYAAILGAYWLTTEWKPSRQLVWAMGEAFFIPLTNDLFFNAVHNLSYTVVSAKKIYDCNLK